MLCVGRGASHQKSTEEVSFKGNQQLPRNSFLGTKTTREPPNLAGVGGQFSSCGQCHRHLSGAPGGCTSALPSKRGTLPENKAGKSLAVQGITLRGVVPAGLMGLGHSIQLACACSHGQEFIVKLKPAHIPVPRSWPQRSRNARLSFYAWF